MLLNISCNTSICQTMKSISDYRMRWYNLRYRKRLLTRSVGIQSRWWQFLLRGSFMPETGFAFELALMRCVSTTYKRSYGEFSKTGSRQMMSEILFTPDKSGRFTFPAVFRCSNSMRNNTAFSWGVVKSSLRVWIWRYRHLKWDARLHLNGFGVFIF